MTDYPTPYCHKCIFVYNDFRCRYCSKWLNKFPAYTFNEYTPPGKDDNDEEI